MAQFRICLNEFRAGDHFEVYLVSSCCWRKVCSSSLCDLLVVVEGCSKAELSLDCLMHFEQNPLN